MLHNPKDVLLAELSKFKSKQYWHPEWRTINFIRELSKTQKLVKVFGNLGKFVRIHYLNLADLRATIFPGIIYLLVGKPRCLPVVLAKTKSNLTKRGLETCATKYL